MRIKGYSLAIVLAVVGGLAVPRAAYAQAALGGTTWHVDVDADGMPMCDFEVIIFYGDGTATTETTDDQGINKFRATWVLNGNDLTIKNTDTPETFVGTLNGNEFQATDSFTAKDGNVLRDTCTYTKDSK